jgi:hypothetical protein
MGYLLQLVFVFVNSAVLLGVRLVDKGYFVEAIREDGPVHNPADDIFHADGACVLFQDVVANALPAQEGDVTAFVKTPGTLPPGSLEADSAYVRHGDSLTEGGR